MTVIMFILFFMCGAGLKFAGETRFHEDYLSPSKTTAIKGIFVIFVFFRHFKTYLTLTGPYHEMFLWLDGHLGQLIVTLFLFYSGYGVMEAIKKKGLPYVKQLPVPRALKVLLHFDLAVVLFLILNWVMGRTVSLQDFLLSLVCWNSIGNSNWYIFAVVAVYLLTFVAFYIVRGHHYWAAALTTILCGLLVLVLIPYRPPYYYNTILCYPLGLWFSLLRSPIEKVVMKNDILWFSTLTILFLGYFCMYVRSSKGLGYYTLWAILFALIVVCVTMKVRFDNGFLQFLGSHVFSLYILQRLPMWYLAQHFSCDLHPYTYFIASFLITVILALAFDWLTAKLDRILFPAQRFAGAKDK